MPKRNEMNLKMINDMFKRLFNLTLMFTPFIIGLWIVLSTQGLITSRILISGYFFNGSFWSHNNNPQRDSDGFKICPGKMGSNSRVVYYNLLLGCCIVSSDIWLKLEYFNLAKV